MKLKSELKLSNMYALGKPITLHLLALHDMYNYYIHADKYNYTYV